MNANEKSTKLPSPQRTGDLNIAFDVGHSSLGWAVLGVDSGSGAITDGAANHRSAIEILGCGVVIFRSDDCLASARRAYRRQRRHIRSTRQRIARIKRLLLHLHVLSQAALDKPGPACGSGGMFLQSAFVAWPEVLGEVGCGKPQAVAHGHGVVPEAQARAGLDARRGPVTTRRAAGYG